MEEQAVGSAWAVPLVASFVGGLVGGGLTLIGVVVTHRLAEKTQTAQRRLIVRGFLQAILDEVETLWERYQDTTGPSVETLADGQPLMIHYPLHGDYFTVYHTNAFILGQVDNEDLRRKIVSTYTNAKGLLDSFRFNNEALARYENSVWLHNILGNPKLQQRARAEYDVLINYAKVLKEGHTRLKNQVQELLRSLRKEVR